MPAAYRVPGLHFVLPLCALVGALHASPAEPPAITPTKPIIFYNGTDVNDLSRFYRWLGPLGRDHDPHHVFTVVDQIDGAPAIRVSGEDWGGLITPDAYTNYKLVLEYRWGNLSWGERKASARNSGILLHCVGEDGNYKPDFKAPWVSSIEYEILEGRTADIVLVSGAIRDSKERIVPHVTMTQTKERIWDPAGTAKAFTPGMGQLHWRYWDEGWKDVFGFRGARDVDRPLGQWNRVEVIAQGDRLTYFLNSEKVMEVSNVWPTAGRLLFQSEGAEIFFRKIELLPLPAP